MTRNERNTAMFAANLKRTNPELHADYLAKVRHSAGKPAKQASKRITATITTSKHAPLADGGICESHMKGAK